MIDQGNPAMRAFLADQLLQEIKAPVSKGEATDSAKRIDAIVERISDEEKAKMESIGYGPPVNGPSEYTYISPRLPPASVAGPTFSTALTPCTLSLEQKQMIDEGNPAMRAFLADQLLQEIKAPVSKEEAKDSAKRIEAIVERISDEEKAKMESMGYGPPVTGPSEYTYISPRLPPASVAGPTLSTALT